MSNETIICVLLLKQPFTKVHAFLMSSGLRFYTDLYQNECSPSDHKSLCILLLLECSCLDRARILMSGVMPASVLHPPVLPSGNSAVFQHGDECRWGRRFPHSSVCRLTCGLLWHREEGVTDIDGNTSKLFVRHSHYIHRTSFMCRNIHEQNTYSPCEEYR